MSALIRFLENRQWTTEELVSVFFEQFGVKVNHQGDIYQFKYDDRAAKHHLDVTQECRGSILLCKDGKWSYLARPFDKFFNITEGHCPLFSKKMLSDFGQNLDLMEKADGSLLILWWNSIEEKWAMSTSGSITTLKPMKKGGIQSAETFEAIFYRVSKLSGKELGQLDKGHSYLFELCSSENPIITQYNKEQTYLLGVRSNESGAYLDFDSAPVKLLTELDGIALPKRIKLENLALETKEELMLFIEQESRTNQYGKCPEGFVLYRNQEPIAKLKNRTYLQFFYTLGGNKDLAKKGIMESVVAGSIDDIYGHLDQDLQAYADKLKLIAEKKISATLEFLIQIAGKDDIAPKEFAIEVKEKVPSQFQSFFFQNRQALLNKELDGRQAFDNWLQINAGKIQLG